jgi:serine/threonine protein kinase
MFYAAPFVRFPKEELRIGKYQLLQRLASGGMGEVFLALQEGPAGFRRKVVIKRMRSPIGDNPAFVEMFLNEARLAALLSHPNVVHILELGQAEDGSWFIAMEHIDGRTLRDVLNARGRRGTLGLPPEIAARVCADILRGLHHAHEMRDAQGKRLEIIHRDVSPENILVSYSGTVKIVDFGIAKAVSESSTITHVSQLKGKVPYLAPEQLRFERLDARTDVYSTGCLLYEVLCGQSAFPIHSEADLMEEVLTATPIPLSVRSPHVPQALEAITLKAMAKLPADRFSSAQEMATALEDFLVESQVRVPPEQVSRFFSELFGAAAAAGPIPTPAVSLPAAAMASPAVPAVPSSPAAAVNMQDVEDRPTELMASTLTLPPPEFPEDPGGTRQPPKPGRVSEPPAPRLLGPLPSIEPRRASLEASIQGVEVRKTAPVEVPLALDAPIQEAEVRKTAPVEVPLVLDAPIQEAEVRKTAPVEVPLPQEAQEAATPSLPPEPAQRTLPTGEVPARPPTRRWWLVAAAVVVLGLLMVPGVRTLRPSPEPSANAVSNAPEPAGPASAAGLPAPPPAVEDSVGKAQAKSEQAPTVTARPLTSKDKKARSSRKGLVILQVQPSAEVFHGARKLGVSSSSAPLELELPAGQYTLTLKNAELGVTRRITVKVAARGKAVITQNLGRPTPKRP